MTKEEYEKESRSLKRAHQLLLAKSMIVGYLLIAFLSLHISPLNWGWWARVFYTIWVIANISAIADSNDERQKKLKVKYETFILINRIAQKHEEAQDKKK